MADGALDATARPTEEISVREIFGIDSDMKGQGVSPSAATAFPTSITTYKFDPETNSLRSSRGFTHNRRVDDPGGIHGTGKSRRISNRSRPPQLAGACGSISTATSPHRPQSARTRSSCATASRSRSSRGGHPALGAQEPLRHRLRRIYDAGAGRRSMVRHPARPRDRWQADALLDQNEIIHAAPLLPAFCDREHRGPRRHDRASTTAPSRSTRARWTAGLSWRR